MIKPERIAELRKLAEKATSGPYLMDEPWACGFIQQAADAEFIAAASPKTIIELLDERKKLVAIANCAEFFEKQRGVSGEVKLREALAAWKKSDD